MERVGHFIATTVDELNERSRAVRRRSREACERALELLQRISDRAKRSQSLGHDEHPNDSIVQAARNPRG